MIIVKLFGGLGNQMFEYAAAKSLALRHRTEVKLDISGYKIGMLRNFELGDFTVEASVATLKDIARVSLSEGILFSARNYLGRYSEKICKLLKKSGLQTHYYTRYYQYNPSMPPPSLMIGSVASQRFFHFDSEFHNCPDNIFIIGTWISYKYFESIRDILLAEFSLKMITPRLEELAELIDKTNSISIHVRRADKLAEAVHPVVPLNFYKKAIEYFRRQFSNCTFFIFSDDEKWVKSNICGNDCLYVTNEGRPAAEDLWLMSRCRHNVVPVSTFSWWAAWLNTNPDKQIVIAPPSFWITQPNFDTTTVSPPGWVVMKPE